MVQKDLHLTRREDRRRQPHRSAESRRVSQNPHRKPAEPRNDDGLRPAEVTNSYLKKPYDDFDTPYIYMIHVVYASVLCLSILITIRLFPETVDDG